MSFIFHMVSMSSKELVISILKGVSVCPCADWNAVLETAVKEGVFYPLFRALVAGGARLPDGTLERFRQTYYLHLAESARFSVRVERLLKRLGSLSVPVLLFKGPAVDRLIYGDYLRPRLDLDVCVRDADASRLAKVLEEMGYAETVTEKGCPLPEYLNSRLFGDGTEDCVPVHVHRQLVNNLFLFVDGAWSLDMGKVWEETMPFGEYVSILMLKPEMNLVYLCEHGLKHGFDQTVYLYEIDRLIRFYGLTLDWKKLVGLARSFKLARIVYHALYLSREMFGCGVPEGALGELRPERLMPGERAFARSILAGRYRRYASYPVYLSMRKGLAGKTKYLFRTVFPPSVPLKGHLVRLCRSILPQ